MLLSWAFAVHAMIPAKRRVPIFLSVFFIIIGVFSAKLVKTNGFSSFFMFALVEIWYFARQSTIFTLALLLEDRRRLGKMQAGLLFRSACTIFVESIVELN